MLGSNRWALRQSGLRVWKRRGSFEAYGEFKSQNVQKEHRVLSTLGLVLLIDIAILWGRILVYKHSQALRAIKSCYSAHEK